MRDPLFITNISDLFLIKLVKNLVTAFLTVVSDLRRSSKHIAEASKSKKPGWRILKTICQNEGENFARFPWHLEVKFGFKVTTLLPLHSEQNTHQSMTFSNNFCLLKTELSGNTVWPQVSGFQKLAKKTKRDQSETEFSDKEETRKVKISHAQKASLCKKTGF